MGPAPPTKSPSDTQSHRLIWLDADVDTSPDNLAAQRQLRKLNRNLRKFSDENKCYKYLISTLSDDRIILIVSGRLGRVLVPKISELPQVKSICVYCENVELNKQWADSYAKVKVVADRFALVIAQIETDRDGTESGPATASKFDNKFISYFVPIDDPFDNPLAFLECLIHIESNEKDFAQFILYCKNRYKDDPQELESIRKFERDYSSSKALEWYRRQSFVYRTLSSILRRENIALIYSFRFLIRDIYQQLKQNQCSSLIKAFRAQSLPDRDVVYFKGLVGKTITVKSFLTAYLDRDRAQSALKPATVESKQVLFKIKALPQSDSSKPFGSESINEERTVIFMAASSFRIESVQIDKDQIWIIKLTLISDRSPQWTDFLQRIDRIKQHPGEFNLVSYSTIMRDMGNLDRAQCYCYRVLDALPSDSDLVESIDGELAVMAVLENESDVNRRSFEQTQSLSVRFHGENRPSSASRIVSEPSQYKNGSESQLQCTRPALVNSLSERSFSLRLTSLETKKCETHLPLDSLKNTPLVSLEEALFPLKDTLSEIERMANIAKSRCQRPADNLTPDESAAIMLYTMEWDPVEASVYFAVNTSLRSGEISRIRPWLPYLKLIVTALSRLPIRTGTIFRGVKFNLVSQYSQNEKFYWWSFSSCTTTLKVLKAENFLGGDSDAHTLFAIESLTGRDISRHSFHQEEDEILLLPATRLQVLGYISFRAGVDIIQLREIVPEYSILDCIK